MPVIEVEGDFEKAVRKFNREVERTGILNEFRRREHYEKPSAVRRKKLPRRESLRRRMEKRRSSGKV